MTRRRLLPAILHTLSVMVGYNFFADIFPDTLQGNETAQMRLPAVRQLYPPGTFTCNHLDMPTLFNIDWDAIVAKDLELVEQARSDNITRAITDFLLEELLRLAPRSRNWTTPRTWQDIVQLHCWCRDLKAYVQQFQQNAPIG